MRGITKEAWVLRKKKYGKSGVKNPIEYRQHCSQSQIGKHRTPTWLIESQEQEIARSYPNANFNLHIDQLRYIAGFLDGDGDVVRAYGRGVSPIRITLHQKIPTPLVVIQGWLHFGVIHKRWLKRPYQTEKYLMYAWRNQVTEFSLRLLDMLAPYLRRKHKNVEGILQGQYPFAPMSWGYISGFMDAEGSSSASMSKKYVRAHDHYVISIAQKNLEILKEIHDFMGYGKLYEHSDNKGMWNLNIVNHEKQLNFIEHVLPFSIVKKQVLTETKEFILSKDWDAYHKKCERLDGNAIKSDYENHNLSERDLAEKYETSLPTIQRKLQIVGTRVRPLGTNHTLKKPNPMESISRSQLQADYDLLGNTYAVGDKYGMSQMCADNTLKRKGVIIKPNAKLANVPNAELIAKYKELGTVATANSTG